MKPLLLLYCLFLTTMLSAQKKNADDVLLRYTDTSSNSHTRKDAAYFIVKFKTYPGVNWLQANGLVKSASPLHHILKTFPDTAGNVNIIAIYPANTNWKCSEQLLRQLDRPGSKMSVLAALDTTQADPLRYCHIDAQSGPYAYVTVQKKDWPRFIAQPALHFADIQRMPHTETPASNPNPGMNRINALRYHYPTLLGEGTVIGIKEALFDTTDIDLKGKAAYSALLPDKISAHTTDMAIIIAGLGNSGPVWLGVAPMARLSPSAYDRLLPDNETYFSQQGIAVQNHSYGVGTENYYGAEAAAYDELVYKADTLMHVFSSGNAGNVAPADGLYRGLKGFSNLSGTFKQAKNVLVVGAADNTQSVAGLSSRGPAYDGRIKPEMIAYGENGTSDAAALTTGVVALLQEAYRRRHGRAPSSALIKALLVNSAAEINGAPLQFDGGYGALNALGAATALQEGRFAAGSLQPGQVQTIPLEVAPNTRQLKVTLAWNDPAAGINAPAALVNDLNLLLKAPDGQQWKPWTLSTFPAKDSLLRVAERATDTLNNLEQVSVTAPQAGHWEIQVSTGSMKTASQPFYVSWQQTAARFFQWQSPVAGEAIPANQPLTLRWQTGSESVATAYYSLDSGVNWIRITEVSLRGGSATWMPPAVFSKARLKMVTQDTTWESGDFTLSTPLPLFVGFNCSDSIMLYWPAHTGAGAYQVHRLENDRLTLLRTITDTLLVLHRNELSSGYFAVSPLHPHNWSGIRGNTLDYRQQPVDCYFKNLLADVKDEKKVLLTLQLGTLYRVEKIVFERMEGAGFTEAASLPVSASATYTYLDTPPHAGLLRYRIRLVLDNGSVVYSRPITAAINGDKDHQVFPNPASSFITIMSRTLDEYSVQLTDMLGRTVINRPLTRFVQQIPVTGLTPGVYILTIMQRGRIVRTEKMVVVKP